MMSFNHAKHNEKLCDELLRQGKWNDWVVTTAFYSAIHYIDEALFPLTVDKVLYKSFDEYYSSRIHNCNNKHQARKLLVKQFMPNAYGAFSFLLDNCKTARYNDYAITPGIAQQARLKLTTVKDESVALKKLPVVPATSVASKTSKKK